MSGFFWNIRGFNRYSKQLVVRDWIRFGGFSFGCMIETRVKEGKSDAIFKSVFPDWSLVRNYEFNRRGRLWVVYDGNVQMTIIAKCAQAITCVIKLGTMEEFCCSFVYASNFVEERKLLWAELRQQKDIAAYNNLAWLCFGDFNEILELEEHSVEGHGVSQGMTDFQDVIRYCSMVDMNKNGPLFTWSNSQADNLISKKLDRCLLNDVALDLFTQAYCVFESGGCSDHLRGRFYLTGEVQKMRGPFKFVNAIASYEEFLPTVSDYWKETDELYSSTSTLFRLTKKLKDLKPALKALGKKNVAIISARTKEALADLKEKQEISLRNPTQGNTRAETLAFEWWERATILEEKFLRQRSKLHWLKVGDQNSKAFYNAIKVRHAQNAIREVLDPNGVTLTSQDPIILMFIFSTT